MEVFIQGVIIGFAIAAPVGVIGVLCIQKTVENGFRSGLLVGLGAATADAVYGAIAGFGVVVISDFLVDYQDVLKVIGGLFIIYLGIRAFMQKSQAIGKTSHNLAKDYISTFFLTLTNPITIVSFLAIFAGLEITTSNHVLAVILVSGVFLGSALWWLLLSGSVNYFHKNVKSFPMILVNRLSGTALILFGLYILLF